MAARSSLENTNDYAKSEAPSSSGISLINRDPFRLNARCQVRLLCGVLMPRSTVGLGKTIILPSLVKDHPALVLGALPKIRGSM